MASGQGFLEGYHRSSEGECEGELPEAQPSVPVSATSSGLNSVPPVPYMPPVSSVPPVTSVPSAIDFDGGTPNQDCCSFRLIAVISFVLLALGAAAAAYLFHVYYIYACTGLFLVLAIIVCCRTKTPVIRVIPGFTYTVTTPSTGLSVRVEPNENADIFHFLPNGTAVTVLESRGNWFKHNFGSDSSVGWSMISDGNGNRYVYPVNQTVNSNPEQPVTNSESVIVVAMIASSSTPAPTLPPSHAHAPHSRIAGAHHGRQEKKKRNFGSSELSLKEKQLDADYLWAQDPNRDPNGPAKVGPHSTHIGPRPIRIGPPPFQYGPRPIDAGPAAIFY